MIVTCDHWRTLMTI